MLIAITCLIALSPSDQLPPVEELIEYHDNGRVRLETQRGQPWNGVVYIEDLIPKTTDITRQDIVAIMPPAADLPGFELWVPPKTGTHTRVQILNTAATIVRIWNRGGRESGMETISVNISIGESNAGMRQYLANGFRNVQEFEAFREVGDGRWVGKRHPSSYHTKTILGRTVITIIGTSKDKDMITEDIDAFSRRIENRIRQHSKLMRDR